ncbi:hypothetical protein FPJ27_15765 [Burkholderia sp. MS455]|uniref:hypothetical protein n=1 Tax=Burkholderia sp. MS455 TaxID=2811788 RepID=UPI0019575B75|nr:hypothetical protein [Burkholderia sp. MS455]QRR07708.1 hypothetical protein FPJ27_15765 [Burkholderia sp. MS455]
MATNYLSWGEFRRLLSPPQGKVAARGAEFVSAQGIALETYADLLGENQSIIETGFLDTLGFPAAVLNTRGIRRCEACARAGYHCTLFSIKALTHCPWHQTRLTRGCVTCAKTIRTAGRRTLRDAAICPACGSCVVDPAWRLSGVTDLKIIQESENCCGKIVEWWRSVCSREPDADELFGDVLGSDGTKIQKDMNQLKWGAMFALARPPDFGMNHSGTPATVLRWRASKDDHVNEGDTRGMLDVQRYRSVRRHIFRRFVRPHRRCLSILTSGEQADLYYLDREHACTVCIAFIAWRKALEQCDEMTVRALDSVLKTDAALPRGETYSFRTLNPNSNLTDFRAISDVRDSVPSSQRWKLRLPIANGGGIPAELVPHFLYAEFLRIWMELEVCHIGFNIKVIVDPLVARNSPLPMAQLVSSNLRSTEPLSIWKVVVPNVQLLAEKARERCSHRELNQCSMFNGRNPYPSEGFSWQLLKPYSAVFLLRYRRGGSSRIWRYILP